MKSTSLFIVFSFVVILLNISCEEEGSGDDRGKFEWKGWIYKNYGTKYVVMIIVPHALP